MEKVRYGNLVLAFSDGFLSVKVPTGEPFLTVRSIADLNDAFDTTTTELDREREDNARRHAQAVQGISSSTGLPVKVK
ncbi:MAG: hypothetical protein ABI040_02755 [Rhodoferax sp.]